MDAALESCRAVSQRAAQTLKIAEKNRWLLDIALDHLTLGRAALYAAILEGRDGALRRPRPSEAEGAPDANIHAAGQPLPAAVPPGSSQRDDPTFETARRELDAAVAGLRRANRSDYLPRALLTRAWCSFAEAMEHRLRNQHTQAAERERRAQEDLDEAWEIAERGPMKLFMADIHLTRCRLFGMTNDENRMTKYPWESPAADLKAAEELISKCGYHRRDEEVADAKRAILDS